MTDAFNQFSTEDDDLLASVLVESLRHYNEVEIPLRSIDIDPVSRPVSVKKTDDLPPPIVDLCESPKKSSTVQSRLSHFFRKTKNEKIDDKETNIDQKQPTSCHQYDNEINSLPTHNNDSISNSPAIFHKGPDANGFHLASGSHYLYPSNFPVREYQMEIIKTALFHNTLVSLPTGMGKTFIAAVVMYNFYRWYPMGKIVFMAPTRPLVAQQIEACHSIMGIPKDITFEMTGNISPEQRYLAWKKYRVFFLTPQVMANDLSLNKCPSELLRCIIIDEAHRATKDYAYVQVLRKLHEENRVIRVIGLSATPGTTVEAVTEVVQNLNISKLEFRTDESPDVAKYTNKKDVECIPVKLTNAILNIRTAFLGIYDKYSRRLKQYRALSGNVTNLSKFQILGAKQKFQTSQMAREMPKPLVGCLINDFSVCMSLAYALELLIIYGVKVFYLQSLELLENHKCLSNDADFQKILHDINNELNSQDLTWSHPKLFELKNIVQNYFGNETTKSCSKIIIFCQYRLVVVEVFELLKTFGSSVKPVMFVGQSLKEKGGLPQKKQLEVMSRFKSGDFNILIATSVAEEGLDIGEVDLIICLEANKSPIKFVQRLGRTGRKRSGKCVTLLTEGKEQLKYKSSVLSSKTLVLKMLKNNTILSKLAKGGPRLIPKHINPERLMIHVKQPEVSMPEEKKRKGKRKAEENLVHVMVKQDDQNEKEEEEGLDVFQNNKDKSKRRSKKRKTVELEINENKVVESVADNNVDFNLQENLINNDCIADVVCLGEESDLILFLDEEKAFEEWQQSCKQIGAIAMDELFFKLLNLFADSPGVVGPNDELINRIPSKGDSDDLNVSLNKKTANNNYDAENEFIDSQLNCNAHGSTKVTDNDFALNAVRRRKMNIDELFKSQKVDSTFISQRIDYSFKSQRIVEDQDRSKNLEFLNGGQQCNENVAADRHFSQSNDNKKPSTSMVAVNAQIVDDDKHQKNDFKDLFRTQKSDPHLFDTCGSTENSYKKSNNPNGQQCLTIILSDSDSRESESKTACHESDTSNKPKRASKIDFDELFKSQRTNGYIEDYIERIPRESSKISNRLVQQQRMVEKDTVALDDSESPTGSAIISIESDDDDGDSDNFEEIFKSQRANKYIDDYMKKLTGEKNDVCRSTNGPEEAVVDGLVVEADYIDKSSECLKANRFAELPSTDRLKSSGRPTENVTLPNDDDVITIGDSPIKLVKKKTVQSKLTDMRVAPLAGRLPDLRVSAVVDMTRSPPATGRVKDRFDEDHFAKDHLIVEDRIAAVPSGSGSAAEARGSRGQNDHWKHVDSDDDMDFMFVDYVASADDSNSSVITVVPAQTSTGHDEVFTQKPQQVEDTNCLPNLTTHDRVMTPRREPISEKIVSKSPRPSMSSANATAGMSAAKPLADAIVAPLASRNFGLPSFNNNLLKASKLLKPGFSLKKKNATSAASTTTTTTTTTTTAATVITAVAGPSKAPTFNDTKSVPARLRVASNEVDVSPIHPSRRSFGRTQSTPKVPVVLKQKTTPQDKVATVAKPVNLLMTSSSDEDSDIFVIGNNRRSNSLRKKQPKLKPKKKLLFIDDEANVSNCDAAGVVHSSSTDTDSEDDDFDSSFIDDELDKSEESTSMTKQYLQSVKSPAIARGVFKIPKLSTQHFNINVYSQVEDRNDNSYVEDSFCVRDASSDLSTSSNTSAHQTSDERPSKPQKRKRIVSPQSSDSDSPVQFHRNTLRKRARVKTSLDFS